MHGTACLTPSHDAFSPFLFFIRIAVTVTFYYATNGANWTENAEWLSTLGECLWFGVFCEDGVRVTNVTLRK